MTRLEEIKEALVEWVLENKDRYPPDGPFGTTFYKRQSWLIKRVEKLEHIIERIGWDSHDPLLRKECEQALDEKDEK